MEFAVNKAEKMYFNADIGCGRNLKLTVDSSQQSVTLQIKCSTPEEADRKKFSMTVKQWNLFKEDFANVLKHIESLKQGEDVNYTLELGQKKRVTMKTGYKCLDFHCWYVPRGKLELAPGVPGVALNFREVEELPSKMQEIEDFLNSN